MLIRTRLYNVVIIQVITKNQNKQFLAVSQI